MTLSTELKSGTKKSHSAAENTKFVASFLRGVVDPEEYRKLIANFYFVYRAMEQEIGKNPIGAVIDDPVLNRTNALEKDLEYYYGSNWRTIVTQTPACIKYVERIHEIADSNEPYLLVGHHYTRYIGDLSGGQILKGIAEKTLPDLPEGEGLHFYDFDEIKDAKAYKNEYRYTLDAIDLDQSQIDAIISEANYAFKLNMYMFDEIQGSARKSLWTLLVNWIKGK